ncbi:uncharacterized protein LOC127282854, partial [Leptopilina boulardi]|uniref:uncharacterized protein LOC127282854 n=1 Tax=Leptopilina boulardi TaxID=63433 RepID=UPI0021F5D732
QQPTRSSTDSAKLLAQHQLNSALKTSSPGHHSLPRKKSLDCRNSTKSHFQRNQPLRRSAMSPTQHHQQQQQEASLLFEYFVPRSVSEFNLAAAISEIAVPPPPPSVLRPQVTIVPPTNSNSISGTTNSVGTRNREKMVTFEEDINCSSMTRKHLSVANNVFM